MATSPSPTSITHLHLKKPSSLDTNIQWWSSTLECQEVQKALETNGLLLVQYNDEQEQEQEQEHLLHETFSSTHQLFNLPSETKLKNSSPTPYFTYHQSGVYETLAVINSSAQLHSFTNLMWPHGNQNFYETMTRMSRKLIDLSKIILCMVCKSYGVLGRTELDGDHEGNMDALFRMMKYSARVSNDDDDEPVLSLPAHTDRSFLTVLCQNEVEGLMFKPRYGDWMKVNPSPGSFIVFAGDALRAWSNGRIHAPLHKVMIKGKKERLCFGMFICPKGDKVVEVFHEFVDDEQQQPALFKPFIFLDYLHYALHNASGPDAVLDSFASI